MEPFEPEFRPPRPAFPPPPQQPGWASALMPIILLLVLALIGYFIYDRFFGGRGTPTAAPRAITPRGSLADEEKTNIDIYKKANPSVVHVSTAQRRLNFFTGSVEEITGTGTGFIWDAGGDIVTNDHVVGAGGELRVTLWNHNSYSARVIGKAPDYDVAVIRISAPAREVAPIEIGTSKDLQVGQRVYAIGNPFGLDQTLTTGIVSALGRSIPSRVEGVAIQNVIQTDAAINPGNSGGPLLDSAGRLIGMNTAIVSRSGSSAGIGFAIPVDTINQIVPQLIAKGRITPSIGIGANDQATRELAQRPGVLILNVAKGSPAEEAGLRPTQINSGGEWILGDIIVKVADKPVNSVADLLAALRDYKPGDTVKLTIIRDGDQLEAPLKLPAS